MSAPAKKRPAGKTFTPQGPTACILQGTTHTMCAMLAESIVAPGKTGLQFAVSEANLDKGRLAIRSGNIAAFVTFCPFCGCKVR